MTVQELTLQMQRDFKVLAKLGKKNRALEYKRGMIWKKKAA